MSMFCLLFCQTAQLKGLAMSEVNIMHHSPSEVCELMLLLREEFDWVATRCSGVLLKKEANRPEEMLAMLSNTKILLTTLDTPILQQLYRRTLERAAIDLVQHIRADLSFLETEAGQRFWQKLTSHLIRANTAGYFSKEFRPYLVCITDSIAEAANLLRSPGMLSTAATLRCYDDMQLTSAYVRERKQWQLEPMAN